MDPITTQMGEALLVRITRIERQLAMAKRLNLILVFGLLLSLALAGLALSSSGAFSSDTTVRAGAFVLQDAAGNARGRWNINADGDVVFELNDQVPSPRLRLSVLPDGSPGISLKDNRQSNRVVMALLEGEGSLAIADATGVTRALFGLAPNDAMNLILFDRSQTARTGLSVDANGIPAFLMNDPTDDGS